jgi:hypothetical protein
MGPRRLAVVVFYYIVVVWVAALVGVTIAFA